MKWDLVTDDTYYRGRKLEYEARKATDPKKWIEYADLKTLKGSYTLGIHGYMNAANLFEARNECEAAIAAYETGFATAIKANNKDLAVILTYLIAQLHEKAADWDAGIAAYERLGAFCAENGAHFQAADAYEHAAELMVLAGRDVSDYSTPIEHWEHNIHHWEEHGHDHDAVWSRNHIELYKKLFGVRE